MPDGRGSGSGPSGAARGRESSGRLGDAGSSTDGNGHGRGPNGGGTRRKGSGSRSKLSAGRRLAADAVRQVRERGAYVQNVVQGTVLPARASREDKAFAELLATGVASTWGTLDELIDRNLDSPDDIGDVVRDALRISAYEMLFLGKPDHVAVDQGVELVRYVAPRAAGLGNAVLRKMARDAKGFPWGDIATDDAALARSQGFPLWLAELLVERYGRESAQGFMRVCNEPAPMFLAVNSIKADVVDVMEELESAGAGPKAYGPEGMGCILVSDPSRAVSCDALRDGRAVVSDASAQLAALVATPVGNGPYLEVGSGRGTKTVLLQSNAFRRNGRQAQMCCVDLHAFKNGVLRDRVELAGLEGVSIFEGDATRLDRVEGLPAMFSQALVDAPCSGLGTLRRHPEIRWRCSPDQVSELAAAGLGMLRSAAPLIEPGGFIVFSTCTVAREEDEDVVEAFLASGEGRGFSVEPVGGRSYLLNGLSSGGPDVHFVAKLVRGG